MNTSHKIVINKEALARSAKNYFASQLELRAPHKRSVLVRCVFHEDKHASLSINLETGAYNCFACGAKGGDAIDFHRQRYGASFKDAYRAVCAGVAESYRNPVERKAKPEEFNESAQRQIERVWRAATPVVKGDPVDTYLVNRGLQLDSFPNSLRYHPNLCHHKDEATEKWIIYPAMVAKIESSDGKLVNCHRTFLTGDGNKAPVEQPKKLMRSARDGATKGAAIRLFAASELLGIAEGIETAIACFLATGIPTWAAISTSGMKALLVPPEVSEVVIFADNDRSGAGQKAAYILAGRLLSQKRRVKVLVPPRAGVDWLDEFVAEREEARHVQ